MRKKREVPPWILDANSALYEEYLKWNSHPSNEEHLAVVVNLIECKNALQQVSLVKKIGHTLKQSNDNQFLEFEIRILVNIFLSVENKNALKKTVASILQGLSEPHCTYAVTFLIKEIQSSLVFVDNGPYLQSLKHNIDNIIASLDNFSCGIKAVTEIYGSVLQFFVQGLSFLQKQFQAKTTPQELSELYSVCQVMLKALLMTLQLWDKCSIGKEEEICLTSIHSLAYQLLLKDNVLLNCQTSAGIAVVLIAKCFTGSFEKCLQYLLERNLNEDSDDGVLMHFVELPVNSKLCIWSGIMAAFSAEQLVLGQAERACLLTDVILPQILTFYSAVDHTRLLCCSRTLLLWTEKVCEGLQNDHSKEILLSRLTFDSPAMQQILSYVYNHWEHFIDTVRYQAQDILRNILVIYSSSSVADEDSRRFMFELTQTLLMLPWHQRGKYGALQCIVKHTGCQLLLDACKSLPRSVLEASVENCLACHVGELYEALYKKHREECGIETWQNTWIQPLLEVLLGTSKVQKSCVQLYILPKLLKLYPDSLEFFTSKLSKEVKTSGSNVGALLTCLRIANSLGLLSFLSMPTGSDDQWEGIIRIHTLKLALCSVEDQMRLDAVSLLCSSAKSKEPLNQHHFDIMRVFICHNMFSQSPAFRQQMMANFKKFVSRMKETHAMIQRMREQRMKKDGDNDKKLQVLKTTADSMSRFIASAAEFFFSCVNLRCNFPCRCTSLQALCTMKDVFSIINFQETPLMPTSEHVMTLVHGLRDTYENNKKLALELLSSFETFGDFQDEKVIEEHFEAALSLAYSIRPPDSVTAAYLLQFLVRFEIMSSITRRMRREIDANAEESGPLQMPHKSGICFDVIMLLIAHLKSQLASRSDCAEPAASLPCKKPLFGLLSCIRALLLEVNLKEIPLSCISKWRNLLCDLISVSFSAIQSVMDIVSGNNCAKYIDGDLENSLLYEYEPLCEAEVLSGAENLSSLKTEIEVNAIKAQIALLFSWRMHKEVSLILGMVCQNAEIGEAPLQGTALLSTDQVGEIGNFFIDQMSRVTHRGAFEQAYLGFCQLCQTLWRSRVGDLHCLPKQWLSNLMKEITGESNHFCPTRRSAGVPFMVQALLISEPDVTNSNCLSEAMTCLTQLALTEVGSKNSNTDPQVHALNVLRALYRDTNLGEIVMSFVADGIKAALLGFRAPYWAVRNSATLLFSSLMTRVFGVARSRDEIQRKNSMTGRLFFMRFPSLYEFLLDELKAATEAIANEHIHQSLYPILLLLARLYPSVMEGTDSNLKLEAFLPYLEQCAYSSIWKTRVLAAQAIVPLLTLDRQVLHMKKLLSSLSPDAAQHLPANKIHGILLQVWFLFQGYSDLHPTVKKEINEGLDELIKQSFGFLTLSAPCLANRRAYLNVIELLLQLEILHLDDEQQSTIIALMSANTKHSTSVVFSDAYYTVLARICLRLFCSSATAFKTTPAFLVHLLKFDVYEVRLTALLFLKEALLGDCFLDEYLTNDFILENNKKSSRMFNRGSKPSSCILQDMQQSSTLVHQLIDMAISTETHPGCLALLYQVLCAFPLAEADWVLPNGSVLSRSKKLNHLLGKLEHEKQNDIRCSMLYFSACIAKHLYEKALLEEDASQILQQWARMMECSSSSECSEGERKAAAYGLHHVGTAMFLDQRHILGHFVTCLWRAAVNLLQDDELSIKEKTVEISAALADSRGGSSEGLGAMVPSLALDILIHSFFKHIVPRECEAGISSALHWLLYCDASCQKGERPFEKNEMNSFAEEVISTRTITKNFASYVTSHDIPEDIVLSYSEFEDWLGGASRENSTITMQELCFEILRCVEGLVTYIERSSSALPFSDRNFSIRQVMLYKGVAFLHCMSQARPELKDRLDTILSAIKTGGLKFGSTRQLLKLVLDPQVL